MIFVRLLVLILCCARILASSRQLISKELNMARRMKRKRKNKRRKRRKWQRIKNRKKNICPLILPVHGNNCRRNKKLSPCEYEFFIVPLARPDGSCMGNIRCMPLTECSCVRRKWDCTSSDVDVCQGELPEGAFEDCTDAGTLAPSAAPADTQAPSAMPSASPTDKGTPVDNIFQREDECPEMQPSPNSECSRDPALSECLYEYTYIPENQVNGTCLDAMNCIPLTSCGCVAREWKCFSASFRRCLGDLPEGAFGQCTPS